LGDRYHLRRWRSKRTKLYRCRCNWFGITNKENSSVTKLDNTGAATSGTSGFTSGSTNIPSAIAIDTSGNAWVANSGNSTVTELNSTGTSGTVYTGNGLNNPGSIAIDGLGNIWIGNIGSGTLSTFTSSGSALAGSPFSCSGANAPVSIAIAPNPSNAVTKQVAR
jgi:streptogramin lyase